MTESKKVRCVRHVAYMGRTQKHISFRHKTQRKRLLGRCKCTWEESKAAVYEQSRHKGFN